MERDVNKTSSCRTMATIALVIVVLLAVHFGRMLKMYYDGPSVEEALNSPSVRLEKEYYNRTYTLFCQDIDESGQVRYHLWSTNYTLQMTLTCKFCWIDHVEGLDFRPAGWNYVPTWYVPEDIFEVGFERGPAS